MLRRLETRLRPELETGGAENGGRGLAFRIKAFLGIQLRDVRTVKVFTISGLADDEAAALLTGSVLHDPVLQEAFYSPFKLGADWVLEVGYRPGVTDNEGRTAREALALIFPAKKGRVQVYTGTQYHLFGELTRQQAGSIAKDLLANELIQRFEIKSGAEWSERPGFSAKEAKVLGSASDEVRTIPLSRMDDAGLADYSRANTLALSLDEMLVVKNYYAGEAVRKSRARAQLDPDPTDAELELLAQTWSEHCKHKIFAARIDYKNGQTGRKLLIDSLYKTCIQGSTELIRRNMGKKDFCRSVFKDNAGVVEFSPAYYLCIKVETHNSPSALDPYGGALTGIVGVNRDPMGTGMGANMLCNTDVFCFASPFYDRELPPRLLHPRRVMEGVREGVEHGGNKSGIPTVNGSVVFDERYLGKPLVFCGTVGILPKTVQGNPGYEKKAGAGDVIIMAGGRIGKDGIHGATFSSEELHADSPATAVQIGDPITQRKLYDFIMLARDKGLYSAITDNGAGGLASSVGEMARDTGGCRLDLSRCPLKYDGLRPWEILLSEAQERMTLAVPRLKLDEFMALAERMDVEASNLGEFTGTGYFHAVYGDKTVVWLSMEFLHEGLPRMRLDAAWVPPAVTDEGSVELPEEEQGTLLKNMLARLNICSKEYMIRQYDHEVKGGSVVKPLVGVRRDGPGDAAVLRPVLKCGKDGPLEAVVLAHGICPKFSDYDTYWMMANAIDEAVRNAVAVGADPERMAGVDNFCWCDPVQSEKTPDGQYKLAQLVRANQALADFCLAFNLPCISGKDSMKNDYHGGGVKISIPPTVLFSLLGFMPDASKAVTSDFKKPGEIIYLLGLTRRELAGSELHSELGKKTGLLPQVDALTARKRYRTLHQAMQSGLVTACHDLSDGGLAVALAEMSIGGRLGADVEVSAVPTAGGTSLAAGGTSLAAGGMSLTELLYSESAGRLLVTVSPEKAGALEALFGGQHCGRLGRVNHTPYLSFRLKERIFLREAVENLVSAFKKTLDW